MPLRSYKLKYFVFLLFLFACETQRQYTSKPSRSIINPDSDLIEVNALVFHQNDSSSFIYVEVVNENLIYKRPDTSSAFYAEVKVNYKLLPEQNSRKIIDSGSAYLFDRAVEKVDIKSLYGKFNVSARQGNNYYIDMDVIDMNKKVKYRKGVNIYKQNLSGEQNFLVRSSGKISFNNRFLPKEEVNITMRRSAPQVTVDCFFKEFPIAAPPFSLKDADELKYKPDSVFTLTPGENSFKLVMPARGFLHVRTEANSFEGLSLYAFDKSFPGVSNSMEMINCTRYIMNKEEYEQCKNSADRKSCIDNFWLTVGGSNERAKELLKKYYGRVKEANKYYSSYCEGWKTDRGMIFIMFGPPTSVYRHSKGETWLYGLESNPNALRYIFNKTKNPFSDNDYVLERSQFYKDHWYQAEDVWRNGHVYLIQEK